MSNYNIHEDLKELDLPYPEMTASSIKKMNKESRKMKNLHTLIDGVKESSEKIKGFKKGSINLTIVEPESSDGILPCLIYYHGGGFVFEGSPEKFDLVCEHAIKTPCKVVFVDYRLAPKYPFPVGVEDSFAAFEWVYNNASTLNIDANRIAVMGDSAGGNMAAVVTLMARDRKIGKICYQMLMYPVIDRRLSTKSIKEFTDTPIWNSILTRQMWELYLRKGIVGPKEYASPIEAESLIGLPEAYIEVAEFDCLRDEGIDYAKELRSYGVRTELYILEGAVHGFERQTDSEYVRRVVDNRIEALKKAFEAK